MIGSRWEHRDFQIGHGHYLRDSQLDQLVCEFFVLFFIIFKIVNTLKIYFLKLFLMVSKT